MKSTTPNSKITANARSALSGNRGKAIGAFFIYILFLIGLAIADGVLCALLFPPEFSVNLIQWIFEGALMVGLAAFFISITDGVPMLSRLFDGFNRFGRSFGAYFMYSLFILLWMLLLIIPGIIKCHSYAMTFYILADDPNIGVFGSITRSRVLMDGNKWKYFRLQWRFFGWTLLCVLTLGIGFIWLAPYMQASMAAFYQDVKEQG